MVSDLEGAAELILGQGSGTAVEQGQDLGRQSGRLRLWACGVHLELFPAPEESAAAAGLVSARTVRKAGALSAPSWHDRRNLGNVRRK